MRAGTQREIRHRIENRKGSCQRVRSREKPRTGGETWQRGRTSGDRGCGDEEAETAESCGSWGKRVERERGETGPVEQDEVADLLDVMSIADLDVDEDERPKK